MWLDTLVEPSLVVLWLLMLLVTDGLAAAIPAALTSAISSSAWTPR